MVTKPAPQGRTRNARSTREAIVKAATRLIHVHGYSSTTLDDVFVHYTGRALRDALQEPSVMDRSFMIRRA